MPEDNKIIVPTPPPRLLDTSAADSSHIHVLYLIIPSVLIEISANLVLFQRSHPYQHKRSLCFHNSKMLIKKTRLHKSMLVYPVNNNLKSS